VLYLIHPHLVLDIIFSHELCSTVLLNTSFMMTLLMSLTAASPWAVSLRFPCHLLGSELSWSTWSRTCSPPILLMTPLPCLAGGFSPPQGPLPPLFFLVWLHEEREPFSFSCALGFCLRPQWSASLLRPLLFRNGTWSYALEQGG
jgi:hypothetical protein